MKRALKHTFKLNGHVYSEFHRTTIKKMKMNV